MKYIFTLLFMISTLSSFAVDIHETSIGNGKTAFVEFTKEKNLKYEKILIGKKTYKVFGHPLDDEKMYALIPISYYEKPREQKMSLLYEENGLAKEKSFSLLIKDSKYKKERLKVSSSKVNLSKEDTKRVQKEYHEAMKIYNTSNKDIYVSSKFIAPLESKITSEFGKARVYNDTLKGYHSGTDFRAKTGEPIKASNEGIVVLAKERFYSGGSIILDHGHGIYTCYFHMSKFDVKEGQKVKKAQIIGLSGESGRVTGPHLHFSARVAGVQVDPLQLISVMNKNLLKGVQ
ncbi:M23 family metallopeptidase [bacterium]|nr:M23 family metallopeptidase [bacterium]MBU1989469.1 M23 family metallopeptidase [bacterium]